MQTTIDLSALHPAPQRVSRDPGLQPDPSARPRRPPSSSRAASTSRTARSFNSGGYSLNFGILRNLFGMSGASTRPGAQRTPTAPWPTALYSELSDSARCLGHGDKDGLEWVIIRRARSLGIG